MAQSRTDSISRTYASALFELAKSKGEDISIASQVQDLGDLLSDNPLLLRLMSTPTLGSAQRRDVIQRVFKGKVDETVYNFLQILSLKNRLNTLPGIVQSYADLVAGEKGIIEVDIFVPQKLEGDQLENTKSSIGKILGGREIALHQYIDESLIGGMRIKIGDSMIDGSVASQLRDIQRKMVAGRR